jgi:hypothetical protein
MDRRIALVYSIVSKSPEQSMALNCGPGMIRTCGTWFRKPLLYPLSYGARSLSLSTYLELKLGAISLSNRVKAEAIAMCISRY